MIDLTELQSFHEEFQSHWEYEAFPVHVVTFKIHSKHKVA